MASLSPSPADGATETAESTWADILPQNAEVEQIAGGFRFLEGPVWTTGNTLVFSDIPADTMYEWKGSGPPEVFRQPSGKANGNTLDRQGRIVTCEHGGRRVRRLEADGTITVLADRFEGKRLNSPNDVVVASNGDLYFTDPPYGIRPEEEELGFYGVYRLQPDGTLTLLGKDFVRPNGLAFSLDESLLYLADTHEKHMRVFDVKPDGTLENGRLFAELKGEKAGAPDGIRLDQKGNVYCTGPGGIWVFTPSGAKLGVIETPEEASNCAWGDPDMKALYITADTGLYRIRTLIGGR